MNGFDVVTHPGVFWAMALSFAVLAGVCVMLVRYLGRSRRAFDLERQRWLSDLGTLQARLETQHRELADTNAQLAYREERLAQQERALADAERAIDAGRADLARAHQYHGEILANLSHELRVPLNSALILSQLLADNGPANLAPEQVKFARSIHSAGHDVLQVLNDTLELSHIEARKIELHPESLDLGALIATLAQTFGPIAEQKRLALEVHLAPDVPRTLDSDAQRLAQVLKNLLATAIKLTERGTVSLAVAAQGPDVEFTVRAADAAIRRSGSMGLGLSLARELALLLGGRVEVQSPPGQASTFRFVAPAVARMMVAETNA